MTKNILSMLNINRYSNEQSIVTINLRHRMYVCIDNSFEISEFLSPPCKYGFSTYYDKTRLAP